MALYLTIIYNMCGCNKKKQVSAPQQIIAPQNGQQQNSNKFVAAKYSSDRSKANTEYIKWLQSINWAGSSSSNNN